MMMRAPVSQDVGARHASPLHDTGNFLSVTGLAKIYPSRAGAIVALKEVSLAVGTTQFVSLLGPSGCGKSTLLRCVAGLERPTAGSIVFPAAP